MTDTDDADTATVLRAVLECAYAWEGNARLIGNVRAQDISRACREALALLSSSPDDREDWRTVRDALRRCDNAVTVAIQSSETMSATGTILQSREADVRLSYLRTHKSYVAAALAIAEKHATKEGGA